MALEKRAQALLLIQMLFSMDFLFSGLSGEVKIVLGGETGV